MAGAERRFVFSVGEGRYLLEADVMLYGDSILLHLAGGERPHVGAAAAAAPGQKAKCFSFPGHRDGDWAAPFAERLANALSRNAVVTGGVHIDAAEREELETLARGANRLIDSLLETLGEACAPPERHEHPAGCVFPDPDSAE